MSSEYKKTLNLPNTPFPMKANLPNREPAMLAKWADMNIYQQIRDARQGKKQFILHDGPPYANGALHIGHAVNKILKDIVIKSKTLSGYDAPYIPGWDCHGLPIELNVEKKSGKVGDKINVTDFMAACRRYAKSQVDLQRDSFKRFGVLGEWDTPYLTMNPIYEAGVIRALAKLLERKHLHRGVKPVHWCLDCRSALAEAEVEYKDKTSDSIFVAFPVVESEALQQIFSLTERVIESAAALIWTTTPWTLPANQLVSVHPEFEYVLVSVEKDEAKRHLIIAEALLESVMQQSDISDYEIQGRCAGSALEHLVLNHPFMKRDVFIGLGEHVTLDAGTGLVHTAPAHGLDDYNVAKAYQLEVYNPVLGNGCYQNDLDLVGGQHIYKANAMIIDALKSNNVLLSHTKLNHSYPHCWRHKTPLIFRATPQWFVSMDQSHLRDQVLNAIKATNWVPAWGEARIEGMIAKRPDWCISRQRYWGTPIPFLLHKETFELHPNTPALLETVAEQVEQVGIEAWHALSVEALIGDEASAYEKSTDMLDVWFDSGVSHACVLAQRDGLRVPADLYLEGSDQHRGWFNSSIMTAVGMTGNAPYNSVLTHGFVVDGDGRKMSKSLGNVVLPEQVIKQYGADVLRLWVALTDYRAEMSINQDILKRTAEIYRRIRNTARYLLANCHDFEPAKHSLDKREMLALDRYIVDCALRLQQELVAAYGDYQFHVVVQKIHHFCSIELGSFYLDIIKDRQYTCQTNSLARRSGQMAMHLILSSMVKWIAPILSFTADEIWQYLPEQSQPSVLLTEWSDELFSLEDNSQLTSAMWDQILLVRTEVNKLLESARKSGQIGAALEASVSLYVDAELMPALTALADELHFVLITSNAKVSPLVDKPDNALATELPGLFVTVESCQAQKCDRCWHRCDSVGQSTQHPLLCKRCVSNVDGEGEQRRFA